MSDHFIEHQKGKELELQLEHKYIILGDPGAVSGGGKKSKQARKKLGQRKSPRM